MLVLTLRSPAPLVAQGKFPPDSLTNLQVIPKDTPVRAVIGMMRGFTEALGVRCQYCHVGEEGQPLDKFDFASDDKRTKKAARIMLKMAMDLNANYLAQIPDRPTPVVEVRCITCHRGVARPMTLVDLMTATVNSAGLDSAVRAYKALRTRYYGRAAYDFGERTLTDAADQFIRANKWDEAMGLLSLNEAQFPTSASAQSQLGEYYRQRGDTANAIARYKAALERDPMDPVATNRLKQLAPKP
jgi:tetratricopeptide (TPR) repeat protein